MLIKSCHPLLKCSWNFRRAYQWRLPIYANDSIKGLIRYSSSIVDVNNFVKTHVDEKSKVASLVLNRSPVNSLSFEMNTAISGALKSIEKEYPTVQSLVLSSSNPNILSAGLDLTEMHKPDPQRLPKFWNSVQQVCLDLYGSRLAIICAIEGHAPGAGCLLAMACDYRIMAASHPDSKSPASIGLNETKFGFVAPPFLAKLMFRTIGMRCGERALQLGTLFNAEEALDVGLVDELVPAQSVIEKSHEIAIVWSRINPKARFASKMLGRKEYIDELLSTREKDTQNFCNFVMNKHVQAGLTIYMENLKKKG